MNWFTLPNDSWEKYKHLCKFIRGNFLRPVYSQNNRIMPCVIFFTTKKDEIGFASCVANSLNFYDNALVIHYGARGLKLGLGKFNNILVLLATYKSDLVHPFELI